MKIKFVHTYLDIISLDNLLQAWIEFRSRKKSKKDAQEFERDLMSNILLLYQELVTKSYKHSGYEAFNIFEPKPRNIHKAKVRDRLLHYAIYRKLYPFFDRTFISDSYSCRLNKGTHLALDRFRSFSRKASQNNTKTLWVLKCDVRKFFANIDHPTLMNILKEYISDSEVIFLLQEVINSFHSKREDIGLPLGNLTSQLFVNIYMNKFDQFMKHKVKAEYYIRYADDFVIMSQDRKWLEEVLSKIGEFLRTEFKLELHPNKVSIETLASGVDFLGWVNFSDHRVLRTATKNRMFRNLKIKEGKPATVQSYLGLLSHGNGKKLQLAVIAPGSISVHPVERILSCAQKSN